MQKSKSAIFDACDPLKYRDTIFDKSVKNWFLQQNLPLTGTVQISGGAWVSKGYNRPMRWELRKNGVTLSLGDLTQSDPYTKDNPFTFSTGSGGPSALQVVVVPNDILELLVYRKSRATFATFVATDFRISRIICPILAALQDAPERRAALDTLYQFRDEVMTQSLEGQRYIELFYQHAWEETWLLWGHPELRMQARGMLVRLLPTLQATVAGQPATIIPVDLADFEALLEAFAVKASPRLRADLQAIQEALRHEAILEQVGIRISD